MKPRNKNGDFSRHQKVQKRVVQLINSSNPNTLKDSYRVRTTFRSSTNLPLIPHGTSVDGDVEARHIRGQALFSNLLQNLPEYRYTAAAWNQHGLDKEQVSSRVSTTRGPVIDSVDTEEHEQSLLTFSTEGRGVGGLPSSREARRHPHLQDPC